MQHKTKRTAGTPLKRNSTCMRCSLRQVWRFVYFEIATVAFVAISVLLFSLFLSWLPVKLVFCLVIAALCFGWTWDWFATVGARKQWHWSRQTVSFAPRAFSIPTVHHHNYYHQYIYIYIDIYRCHKVLIISLYRWTSGTTSANTLVMIWSKLWIVRLDVRSRRFSLLNTRSNAESMLVKLVKS